MILVRLLIIKIMASMIMALKSYESGKGEGDDRHSTVMRMAALPSGQGHAYSKKPFFPSDHIKPPGAPRKALRTLNQKSFLEDFVNFWR